MRCRQKSALFVKKAGFLSQQIHEFVKYPTGYFETIVL